MKVINVGTRTELIAYMFYPSRHYMLPQIELMRSKDLLYCFIGVQWVCLGLQVVRFGHQEPRCSNCGQSLRAFPAKGPSYQCPTAKEIKQGYYSATLNSVLVSKDGRPAIDLSKFEDTKCTACGHSVSTHRDGEGWCDRTGCGCKRFQLKE